MIANSYVGTEEEPRGSNRGELIDRWLDVAGVTPPAPWCAAFQFACALEAGILRPQLPSHPASVFGWSEWARKNGRFIGRSLLHRGDMVIWLNSNHQGHIMQFLDWVIPGVSFRCIEGNANDKGGREGYAVVKRSALKPRLWKSDFVGIRMVG